MTLSSDVSKPDPRINIALSDIEKIEYEKVIGKHFINTDVYIDGRDFEDCYFEKCCIHVKLGWFKVGTTTRMMDCEFRHYPPATYVKQISDILAQQSHPPTTQSGKKK